jgi:hypothetical protein
MHLRTRGSFKSANHNMDWVCKSAKCFICERRRNINVRKFAIFGTYLLTVQCPVPTSGYFTVISLQIGHWLKDTNAVAKNSRKKLETWERGGGTVISERGLSD